MSEFPHFIKRPTNDMLPPTALTSLPSSTFAFPKPSPISPNPHTNRAKLSGTILRNHPDKELASISMEHEVNGLLPEDHQRLQTAGNVSYAAPASPLVWAWVLSSHVASAPRKSLCTTPKQWVSGRPS